MNTLDLRTATLDDIVFEGRNKSYGAFVLRQLYQRHLARALTIAVSLSLLLVVSPLIMARLFPQLIIAPPVIPDLYPEITVLAPPTIIPDRPAGSRVKPPRTIVRPPAEIIPTVVPDNRVKPEDLPIKPDVTEITPPAIGSEIGVVGPVTGSGEGVTANPFSADSGSGSTKAPVSPPVLVSAEVMPEFVGGPAALQRYMQKSLRYPPLALRNSVDGRVFISFTVQADGSIADVQVLKGLGFGTDEEAARVVKNMPAWTPGRQNKHPVAVRYTMPITFRYE